MAIVKMKRLRLMVVRDRKDALLRELARLGCVEFSEIGEELQNSEVGTLVKRESSDALALRSKLSSLEHALELLGKYVPVKKPLLAAKPELEDTVFLDDREVLDALETAGRISQADEQIRHLSAEQSRRVL